MLPATFTESLPFCARAPFNHLACQRMEKRHERVPLVSREAKGTNSGIEVWVHPSSAIVEAHHGVERPQAAVVHVRRRARDLSQRRRLEGAAVGVQTAHGESARIAKPPALPCDASVVELLVAERRPRVTGAAAGSPSEEREAMTLLRRQRIALTVQVVVETKTMDAVKGSTRRSPSPTALRAPSGRP